MKERMKLIGRCRITCRRVTTEVTVIYLGSSASLNENKTFVPIVIIIF